MKNLKRLWLVGMIATCILVVSGGGSNCNQPQIETMKPDSGPGGTIVEVSYKKGGLSGKVKFDGSIVSTRSTSNISMANRVRFTVPYNATAGSKNVQIVSAGGTSPAVTFKVTEPRTVPTPVLEGWAVAHRNGKGISVFGRNFSTLSKVYINGTEVKYYSDNTLPIRLLPFDFVDNVIICTPQSPLTLGSTYSIQVKNPNNKNSNILNVTVPARVCKMDFFAIGEVPVPDYYVWQNNTVNTFRRTFTKCGWILEMTYYTGIKDPDLQSRNDFTLRELYDFWVAYAKPPEPTGGYYMAGIFVADGVTKYGTMFMNTDDIFNLGEEYYRQGFACFWDDFEIFEDSRMQHYFREALHQAGHGFNLQHTDFDSEDGICTLMVTTEFLFNLAEWGVEWKCFFSDTSCEHLRNHYIDAVAPGGQPFGYSRSCNSQH